MPDHGPDVAAVITINDMYHEMQGLRADMQALTGKVDVIPQQVATNTAGLSDHETRIRTNTTELTTIRTQLRAAWAVLGLFVAVVAAYAAFAAH